MKRTRPKPRTAAQQERFNQIKRLGCLISRLRGEGFAPCEIHHLTKLGKRDHDKTIGLSSWRHRGIVAPGYTSITMTETYGPSFAKGSRIFAAAYGSDAYLLSLQNLLLELKAQNREGEFALHAELRRISEANGLKVIATAVTTSEPVSIDALRLIGGSVRGPKPRQLLTPESVRRFLGASRPDRKPKPRPDKILPPRAANWKSKP